VPRLVTLLKFIYAPIQVCDVLILTVRFNLIDFVFKTFPFLVPEMSTVFAPHITQVIFIHFLLSTSFKHSSSNHGL
jgi:hypothetical protein